MRLGAQIQRPIRLRRRCGHARFQLVPREHGELLRVRRDDRRLARLAEEIDPFLVPMAEANILPAWVKSRSLQVSLPVLRSTQLPTQAASA